MPLILKHLNNYGFRYFNWLTITLSIAQRALIVTTNKAIMNNKNREYTNIVKLGWKIKYESHNFYELELDKPLLDKKEFSHSWLTKYAEK